MLYRFLKFLVAIGIRFYYRKIEIKNHEVLDIHYPCILVSNHPNTLMDAMMIGFVTKQPIYFMAKATLFNSPMKMRLLKSLNMIPINRASDGKTSGVSNQDSFEACYRILEEGKTILIFPEGTSFQELHLRELKPGAARIALETEKRNQGKLGLKILPVGLNYMQAERFRSDVLVKAGSPISVAEFLSEYEEKSSQTARRLTDSLRTKMEQLLINVDVKEEEKLIEELHRILTSKYIKNEEKGVEGEVQRIKSIRDAITEIQLTQPWKLAEIRQLLDELKWKTDKLEIRADFLDRKFRSRMFFRQLIVSIIFLLIGLPIFLFGLIHNIFQYKLTDWIVPKLTKDIEYYAPLAVLFGLVIYPLTYTGFLLLGKSLFDLTFWEQFAYFWSLPLTGLYAFSFYKYLNHIRFKWKFVFLTINNKQTLLELKETKEALRKLLFG